MCHLDLFNKKAEWPTARQHFWGTEDAGKKGRVVRRLGASMTHR